MLRSIARILPVILALSIGLPVAAEPGTATLAPLGLPTAKAATQELKYAFGKEWQNTLRAEVKDDLASSKLFRDIVPEGGDVVFTLSLAEAKRTWDDQMVVSRKGTLEFKGTGSFSWKRGETILSEGSFDVKHAVTLDRQPFRADLNAGWREVMRLAVQDAVDKGHGDGVFGGMP